jgi:multidrug efflux system membrane fusion protein
MVVGAATLGVVVVLVGFKLFVSAKIQAIFGDMAKHPPAIPIAAAEARAEDLPRTLDGIGSVVAVHQVTVAPEIAGRVVQIFFEPGKFVHAGDPLVQLNDKPEQADLLNYRAQARLAQVTLKRAQELIGRQNVPQSTVDADQAALDQANSEIGHSEALIAQKLIRAPFDGQLGLRQTDLGQYLQAGGPIVTLTDLDHLWVTFTLPEQDRPLVAPGQSVDVTVDAFPDRVFHATLASLEPQISTDTRTLKLQATLENPDHALLPGMFAVAHVALPPAKGLVTVPETAVDYSLYGDAVFVLRDSAPDEAGKSVTTATRVFVKTGERSAGRVAILNGLAAGDKVVAAGQIKLVPGSPVTIVPSGTLTPPDHIPTN